MAVIEIYKYHTLPPSSILTRVHLKAQISVVLVRMNWTHLCKPSSIMTVDCVWLQQHWLRWSGWCHGKMNVLFSEHTFRPVDYNILWAIRPRSSCLDDNVISLCSEGWRCREDQINLSLACDFPLRNQHLALQYWERVKQSISVRSFVHFCIDHELVVLDYIWLGITPPMQIFKEASQLFFSPCRYVFCVFKFTCHSLWRKWNKIIANWIHSFRSTTDVFNWWW